MNKSVMKCCICNNNNVGEYDVINHKKYHICCIEELKRRVDKLEEYSRGNIKACENRLNSPFCNLEKVSKELMIHKNYLELLGGDVDDE